jgi:uncharacterized protein (TIGR00251 family)
MDSEKLDQPKYYYWRDGLLYVDLIVQAYSSHDEIVGIQANRLKVRLSATPTAGKANEHLLKLMADYFGVPNNRVHLVKGHQSRMKQISIINPQNHVPEPE